MASEQSHAVDITADDLLNYLETDDSFDFELRILKLLYAAQWFPQHGGTYIDPVTGKDRQFDLRAVRKNGDRITFLAIECKRIKPDFPLLISEVPRTSEESRHTILSYAQGNIYGVEDIRGLYLSNDPVGRSMERVALKTSNQIAPETARTNRSFKTSDGDAFERMSQAIASATNYLTTMATSAMGPTMDHAKKFAFMPILVIPDGQLWAVQYDHYGVMAQPPTQVNKSHFYIGKRIPRFAPFERDIMLSHLSIFTETGIANFLSRFSLHYEDQLFNS